MDLFNVGALFLSRMCEVFSDPPHAVSSRVGRREFYGPDGTGTSDPGLKLL